MFRRKKDEKSEYEKKIDGLEEMCWFLTKDMARMEENNYFANVPNITKWQNRKGKISINDTQKEKIQLVIFSLIEDLIQDKILDKEHIERKYGDVFAMSRTISNRIIKALGGNNE